MVDLCARHHDPTLSGVNTAHPTAVRGGSAFGANIHSGEPVKKTAGRGAGWLGPLEHAILAAVHRLGLRRFFLRDVYRELRVSPPRAHDALRRLIARGLARKLGRGYYELAADSTALDADVRNLPSAVNEYGKKKTSQENAEDTGGPRRVFGVFGVLGASGASRAPNAPDVPGAFGGCGSPGPVFCGVFYDNVMWYDEFGVFRRLGRGVLLDSLPGGRLVYAEFAGVVRGVSVDGSVVLYSKAAEDGAGSVRVEWRPPSGFVEGNGFVSARRMFWLQLVSALGAVAAAVLSVRAPRWVRRSAAAALRSLGVRVPASVVARGVGCVGCGPRSA